MDSIWIGFCFTALQFFFLKSYKMEGANNSNYGGPDEMEYIFQYMDS